MLRCNTTLFVLRTSSYEVRHQLINYLASLVTFCAIAPTDTAAVITEQAICQRDMFDGSATVVALAPPAEETRADFLADTSRQGGQL